MQRASKASTSYLHFIGMKNPCIYEKLSRLWAEVYAMMFVLIDEKMETFIYSG